MFAAWINSFDDIIIVILHEVVVAQPIHEQRGGVGPVPAVIDQGFKDADRDDIVLHNVPGVVSLLMESHDLAGIVEPLNHLHELVIDLQ